MERLKGKFEIILGFVTLVVSLSAFKEELSLVNIDLGYASLSLAEYLLYSVYGFSVCLYLYTMELIVRETKIGSWKIFDLFIWLAYGLFAFILITPILICFNILSIKIYNHFSKDPDKLLSFKNISFVVSLVSQVAIGIGTTLAILKERKLRNQLKIEHQEIIELDNANKLYKDGYFSNSILESFKVLETHLYKKLTDKNHRVPRHSFNDILKLALKENIISGDDLPNINDIRGMRNIAAHTDTVHTEKQAEFALEFIKNLIKRNSNN